ncbi:MAG: hypothetical protein AAFY17_04970 [Cyanobacteria bacterium J06642_11]
MMSVIKFFGMTAFFKIKICHGDFDEVKASRLGWSMTALKPRDMDIYDEGAVVDAVLGNQKETTVPNDEREMHSFSGAQHTV